MVPTIKSLATATVSEQRYEGRQAQQEQKQKAAPLRAKAIRDKPAAVAAVPKSPKPKCYSKPVKFDDRGKKFVADKLDKYIIGPYDDAINDQDGMRTVEAHIPQKVKDKAAAAALWAKELKDQIEGIISGAGAWPETLSPKTFWDQSSNLFEDHYKKMTTFIDLKDSLLTAEDEETD